VAYQLVCERAFIKYAHQVVNVCSLFDIVHINCNSYQASTGSPAKAGSGLCRLIIRLIANQTNAMAPIAKIVIAKKPHPS
jgi:hypothetical protein